jgi:hypothetical protein
MLDARSVETIHQRRELAEALLEQIPEHSRT